MNVSTDRSEPAIRVAVVDDERALREMLALGLGRAGFDVRVAADGAAGITLVREWEPQCIVLDVTMPKLDGFETVPLLRRLTEAPIIMLTARTETRDRIAGIQVGADDYLTKPFDLAELAVRIHAALRRPMLARVERLRHGELAIDLAGRTVTRGTRAIALSTREFDLLATLARRPGRVYTRDELLDLVWGSSSDVSSNSVETYIHYLRTKIDVGERHRMIQTIRGVGYVLRTEA